MRYLSILLLLCACGHPCKDGKPDGKCNYYDEMTYTSVYTM